MICRKSDEESVQIAVDYIRRGRVVVLPTDTVYGFSGIVDGRHYSYHTDEKIRELKGRAEDKPLIQLISKPEDLKKYTRDVVPENLLSKWPGPLTIIVHTFLNPDDKDSLTTTAFRCPGDEWLRKVIAGCGAPIYSTSVNKSGEAPLNDITSIKKAFKNIDLIVDDGDKNGGVPSTIVKIEVDGKITVVRQGIVEV